MDALGPGIGFAGHCEALAQLSPAQWAELKHSGCHVHASVDLPTASRNDASFALSQSRISAARSERSTCRSDSSSLRSRSTCSRAREAR